MARIAITTGALRVPPTYFVVQHAQRLADAHDFEVFARLAEVTDPDLGVVVHDATAFESSLPYARRAPFSVLAGRRMTRQLADFAPDLVHQHFGTWSGPAIGAARLAGAPLVTTLHGYDVFAARAVAGRGGGVLGSLGSLGSVASGSPGTVWHAANVRRSGARSTRLLAVSRYLADEAVAAGMPAERLEVHYQGIDADYFTPAVTAQAASPSDAPSAAATPPELVVSPEISGARDGAAASAPASGDEFSGETTSGVPMLLFVGAFAARKGPQDLLAASLALIGAGVEHRVVFVGQGPLESELRDAARTHPHITVAGALGRDGVRELMREAHALVLPTQQDGAWREAAGLVLLEAQACGTPVVAYRSGGTPEMLLDGTTGVLVAERDQAALAEALSSLLTLDAVTLDRMGAAARDFVVRERSLASSAVELAAHYADLLPH